MTNIELTRQISLINGRLNSLQSEIDCVGIQCTGSGTTTGAYVPLTRTITINGITKQLNANAEFTVASGGSGAWGSITGTIQNQTDLISLLTDKANVIHSHLISDISGLQNALNSKQGAGNYASAIHIHDDRYYTEAEIDAKFGAGFTWGTITGSITGQADLMTLFSSKADSNHSHTILDIAGLQASLDNKAALVHTHIMNDIIGLQTALDNKAGLTHSHVIADISTLQAALDAKLTTPTAPSEGSVIKYIGGAIVWGNDNTAEAGTGSVDWVNVQNKPSSFTPSAHTHPISDIVNLQTTLNGKAATVHTHVIADTTGLQSALDGKAALAHIHAIADVTGLQTALNGKQAAGSYAPTVHTHVIADVTNLQSTLDTKVAVTRTITIQGITKDLSANAVFTLASADLPNIDAAKITTGVLAPARLGTGTASSSTILFGDGVYRTIPSSAPIFINTGVTSYTFPAGTLLEKIAVIAPTDINFRIGTTPGANDYLDDYAVTGGRGVIDISDYMLTSTTLYFGNMASNTTLKIYIR